MKPLRAAVKVQNFAAELKVHTSPIRPRFCPAAIHFPVNIASRNNVPTAAGLASSASGTAALVASLGPLRDRRNNSLSAFRHRLPARWLNLLVMSRRRWVLHLTAQTPLLSRSPTVNTDQTFAHSSMSSLTTRRAHHSPWASSALSKHLLCFGTALLT